MEAYRIKVKVYLDFLITLPAVDINILELEDRNCPICQEEYHDTLWRLGKDPVHRPVRLNCGHVFGMPCLARWLFFSRFYNQRCPLCRAYTCTERDPTAPSWEVELLVKTVSDIEFSCRDHPSHIWCDVKEQRVEGLKRVLHDELAMKGSKLPIEQIIVLFEASLEASKHVGIHKHRR